MPKCDAGSVPFSPPALPVCATTALLACTSMLALAHPARAQERPADRHEFGATARVQQAAEVEAPEVTEVDARGLQTLRRRMGDGFRIVETLPGTAPVFSGVPYVIVRGAPPSGTALYYDGVPVPSFFHLALGPAIAHPALVSGMRFHAGVAPARHGRNTGGVLVVDGPGDAPAQLEGEAELRLLDAQGLVRTPGRWPVSLHARIGYPDLALDAIGSQASLAYWDYQAHTRRRVSTHSQLTLHTFGAFDGVGDRSAPDDDIDLQFHRLLLRYERSRAQTQVTASIFAGYDRGQLGTELDARSMRLGPAIHVEQRRNGTRVRLGADMEAKLAELDRNPPQLAVPFAPEAGGPDDPNRFLPEFGSNLAIETGPEDFVDQSPLAEFAGRNAMGAYAELAFEPARPVEIEVGVRTDLWIAAGRVSRSVDPRMLARYRPADSVRVHAGLGTAHQAPSSPLPIPGLDDFELDHGLSRSVQAEAGVAVDLPLDLELGLTLFHHRFTHLVFLELVLDCDGNSEPRAPFEFATGVARPTPLCRSDGLPRGSGTAQGVELQLTRELSRQLTGWLSYTLAWADALAEDGTAFTPQYDVRHHGNLVLAWDLGAGLEMGLRLHYRSGKPAVNTIFDFTRERFTRVETRLPHFLRADLQLTYGFDASFGEVDLLLSWANLTFAREATKRDCFLQPDLEVRCEIDFQPAIVLPNAGVRVRL